jgi:hypothetical protein
MSLDVQKAASVIQSMEKKLASQGFEQAENPTAAGALAFYDAAANYITAVTDVTEIAAAQKRAREAVNEILHRTVDTIA